MRAHNQLDDDLIHSFLLHIRGHGHRDGHPDLGWFGHAVRVRHILCNAATDTLRIASSLIVDRLRKGAIASWIVTELSVMGKPSP